MIRISAENLKNSETTRSEPTKLKAMVNQSSELKRNAPKYLSLVVLTVMNVTVITALRYSRSGNGTGKDMYIGTSMVLTTEILKLSMCLAGLLLQCSWSMHKAVAVINDEVVKKPEDTFKMMIPSILYTIQNILIVVALSHLDSVTFQVTYELKTLITALFSVLLLKKMIRKTQWTALLLLMLGVVLVQVNFSFDMIYSPN